MDQEDTKLNNITGKVKQKVLKTRNFNIINGKIKQKPFKTPDFNNITGKVKQKVVKIRIMLATGETLILLSVHCTPSAF